MDKKEEPMNINVKTSPLPPVPHEILAVIDGVESSLPKGTPKVWSIAMTVVPSWGHDYKVVLLWENCDFQVSFTAGFTLRADGTSSLESVDIACEGEYEEGGYATTHKRAATYDFDRRMAVWANGETVSNFYSETRNRARKVA